MSDEVGFDPDFDGLTSVHALEAQTAGRPDVAEAILKHRVGLPAPRVVIVTEPDGRRAYDLRDDFDA